MSPLDYSIDVKQPFEAALDGFKTGLGFQKIAFDQQQQEQKLLKQQQQQQIVQSLLSNPNAKAEDYANAALQAPELAEPFKQAWGMKSAAQQSSQLDLMTRAYAALSTGKPEIAEKLMRDRAVAMQNSGMPEQEVRAQNMWADMIAQAPEHARHYGGLMLANILGPEKFLSTVSTLGQEQRAQEQAPADLRKKEADATKAESEAGVAPQKARTEVEEAQLRIQKLGVEIQKLSGNGGLDPDKQFDYESKLRKEYSEQTKGFQEVREAYGRLASAGDNGAGDIALIYSYMKMLDPGSVVREGEFATAENSAGIPTKITNIYNKALNGERLTPSQRDTFIGQAKALMTAAEKRATTVRGGIEAVAKSYRLNTDNIFYEPSAPAQPSTGASSPAAAAPPTTAPGTAAVPRKYSGKSWTKY